MSGPDADETTGENVGSADPESEVFSWPSGPTPPPDARQSRAGLAPLRRLELDWSAEDLRPGLVRLGLMLTAAGLESTDAVLEAIKDEVIQMVALHGKPEAQKLAATLVIVKLNRELRRAKCPVQFVPTEGDDAWWLERSKPIDLSGIPIAPLLLSLVGIAGLAVVGWMLWGLGAYFELAAVVGILALQSTLGVRAGSAPTAATRIAISACTVAYVAVAAGAFWLRGDVTTAGVVVGAIAVLLGLMGLVRARARARSQSDSVEGPRHI